MMMVMSYTVDGKEYLVLNASAEGSFLPGMAGVRLLADRHQGVGADRVLVFTGTKAEAHRALEQHNAEKRRPVLRIS